MAKLAGDPRVCQYTATASQTTFTYDFEISEDAELTVQQNDTTLTLTTHYTVTGAGEEAGGTVVLVTGATEDDIITITGDTIVQRDTTFTAGGDFAAAAINAEFDRLDDIVSELITAQGQTAKLAVYSESFSPLLPTAEANMCLKVNSDGTAFEMSTYDPDANAALTAADVVLTHADVVLTHADVVLTNADVVTTGGYVTDASGYADDASGYADDASGYADDAAAALAAMNLEAVGSDILPDTDATYALGSTSKKWTKVWTAAVSDLGTPTSGTLTNCTGYPKASETVSGVAKIWVDGSTLYIETT